jgi:hypothetical protein
MPDRTSEPTEPAEDEDDTDGWEIDESSSETEDLAQAYLDEDPSGLSEDDLRKIGQSYDLTLQEAKAMAESMARTRAEVAAQEGFERCAHCNRWYRGELGECPCQSDTADH